MPFLAGEGQEGNVGPLLEKFVNIFFWDDRILVSLKEAIVKTLLKSPMPDVDSLVNYQPAQHLPFLVKITEGVVVRQPSYLLLEISLILISPGTNQSTRVQSTCWWH